MRSHLRWDMERYLESDLGKKPCCYLNDHAILCHDMSRTCKSRRRGCYAANIRPTDSPKKNNTRLLSAQCKMPCLHSAPSKSMPPKKVRRKNALTPYTCPCYEICHNHVNCTKQGSPSRGLVSSHPLSADTANPPTGLPDTGFAFGAAAIR